MTSRIPYLKAEGTAKQVGVEIGRGAKGLIAANRRLYFDRFRKEWGLRRDEVLDRARAYERVIRDADEEYAETMEGVAAGSQEELHDIVALNVRYEIAYSEYARRGQTGAAPAPPEGCTALAVLPSRIRGGRLIMAQNWDWISGVRGLILQGRVGNGPEVLAFTEAGIVGGKIGLNSRGLGLLVNGLHSDRDRWDRLGMPFHVRCWQILRCGTIDEGSRRVREPPGSCSANFLLGQADGVGGRLLDLETSPVGSRELKPREGVLTHANHFHDPEGLGITEPLLDERTSTHQRQERVNRLLGASLGRSRKLDLEGVKRVLRDHDGQPRSICRHPDPSLPHSESYETIVSIILDLTGSTLLISEGAPCSSAYTAFSLTP